MLFCALAKYIFERHFFCPSFGVFPGRKFGVGVFPGTKRNPPGREQTKGRFRKPFCLVKNFFRFYGGDHFSEKACRDAFLACTEAEAFLLFPPTVRGGHEFFASYSEYTVYFMSVTFASFFFPHENERNQPFFRPCSCSNPPLSFPFKPHLQRFFCGDDPPFPQERPLLLSPIVPFR